MQTTHVGAYRDTPALDSGFHRNDVETLTLTLSPAEGEGR
jgi:hypothetical protein